MSNGQKKGLHPMAWVAIGCAGLLLVVFLVVGVGGAFVFKKGKELVEEIEANPTKAAAELVVRVNPELDLVESDEEAGTMTIRNNKTDQVITLDYEAIKDGRFEWETDEGEKGSIAISTTDSGEGAPQLKISTAEGDTKFGAGVDLSEVPDWVPAYPNTIERKGTFSSQTAAGVTGAYSFSTSDKPQAIIDYYEKLLGGQGFEISKQTFQGGNNSGGNVSGTRANDGRTVSVFVQAKESGSEGMVQFSESKQ